METYKEYLKRKQKEEAKKRELLKMAEKAENDKCQKKLMI